MFKTRVSVDNSQDIIDSRDVIARIEELESEQASLEDALTDAQEALSEAEPKPEGEELATLQDAIDTAEAEVTAWAESDEATELKILQALAEGRRRLAGLESWGKLYP
jgi:DNA repair exonuclease SbcCD ATPase subunit